MTPEPFPQLGWVQRDMEDHADAPRSPTDNDTGRRCCDLRLDWMPGNIDGRLLQTGKLRDGRVFLFGTLD